MTQVRGGFARQLLPEAIILFRNDWYQRVEASRGSAVPIKANSRADIALATSIAEIYRENGELELLASFYHSIGNHELRDKYVEEVLAHDPDDFAIIHLRAMQGRQDLIPDKVIKRRERALRKDPSQRARLYRELGRTEQAAEDYMRGAIKSLRDGRPFSAAYYLKELAGEGVIEELFKIAFDRAVAAGELWWAARALEELEWRDELNDFVLRNATEIEASGDMLLLQLLRHAQGDDTGAAELAKELARGTRKIAPGIDARCIKKT